MSSLVLTKRRKNLGLSITWERLAKATPQYRYQESTSWHMALLIICHTPLVIDVKDAEMKIEHLLIAFLAHCKYFL